MTYYLSSIPGFSFVSRPGKSPVDTYPCLPLAFPPTSPQGVYNWHVYASAVLHVGHVFSGQAAVPLYTSEGGVLRGYRSQLGKSSADGY